MIQIEAAVTSLDEARGAVAAGADRLELCQTLEVGGVTPSTEIFLRIRELVAIPIWVLIRPRGGDFVYSEAEFDTLKRDAARSLEHGADGIVVGVLNADRSIDIPRSRELAVLAGGRAVFHRAFDELADRRAALEQIIGMGYRRILTSGGAATALDGADEIAELVRLAAGRIELLPGAGIGPANAAEIVRRTGCTQVHGSFRDGACATNPELIRATRSDLTTKASSSHKETES
jgi:copper homeostasis protein